jgi:ElaB/YqjD/DUF883 family membrane-anchored ribosome-binding protein
MSEINFRGIRWSNETGRLARHIATSERMTALLPRDEVNALLAKHRAAVQTLEAARKLRPELPDIAAKVEPAFAKGEAVDPAGLIDELAEAQTKHDQITKVIAALAGIPDACQYELEVLINRSADGFIEKLDEQLQDLLDEAEEVLQTLGGVTDPASAIAEDKVEQWKRWTALHRAYISLRRDHLEVLKASAPAGNFAQGRPAIGYAFYRSLASAVPDFVAALEDGGATRARLPFNILDPADPEHWRMTVVTRKILEPVVEFADEAIAASAAAHADSAAGVQPDQGRLAREYGGEEAAMRHSYVAQQARAHGPEMRAREAELRRKFGFDA